MRHCALILLTSLLPCTLTHAADFEFERKNVYVGGGLGVNSLDGWNDAIGFQFFGGYDLEFPLADGVNTLVEVGYMDSGSFEQQLGNVSEKATGLWTTGMATYRINEQILALGRAGLDLGDDSGLMIGAGVDYRLNARYALRFDVVQRNDISSLQLNLTYDLE